ncbi:hypothetical protein PGB28_06850 [Primorskyibacter aestuariivivens]|uniref:DUF6647 family protein n=1 Tax=Primorskyibacter aestuariivivens TaxID=1888912 RepID=UPI00230106E4|nr:DUF6647 family protein [Primorskyibacter aestuariivivens]MDA7428170.1 hypothetical protein [Primorskyibacter aestuariivivens]
MRILIRASLWLARTRFLCLFILLVPAHASADLLAWRDARNMGELVAHLETWLDRNTDLPRRDSPPEIRMITTARAASLAPGKLWAGQDTLRGLYDPEAEAIWLVRPWDARNPFDASTLLHELIHHRQAASGHWYCPGAQELPAYRIQQAWLNEMGLEPDVNWIAVMLEAGCTPRDIHPD